MNLGSYEIPEARLLPCIADAKTLYEAIGSEEIGSNDVAQILGYKTNTTTPFYRRLNSMTLFGLVERKGKCRVSELGKKLAYPEKQDQEALLKRKAVLNVSLWSELFKRIGKNPPEDTFWVQLKNITGAEAPLARQAQNIVRKWYLEDISQISDDLLNVEEEPSKFSPVGYTNNIRTPSMGSQSYVNPSEDFETINFGKVTIQLPKENIKQWWEKTKKIVEVVLEDYDRPAQETIDEVTANTFSAPTKENLKLEEVRPS
jgi:hypothetical protein